MILKWHFIECYSALSIAIITIYNVCNMRINILCPICTDQVSSCYYKIHTSILSISFLLLNRKKNSIHFITITSLLHFAWLSKACWKGLNWWTCAKQTNLVSNECDATVCYTTISIVSTLNYIECASAKWITTDKNTNIPLTHPQVPRLSFQFPILFPIHTYAPIK